MGDARVGVDLVDVEEFAARFDGRDSVLADMFTAAELTYCRSRRHPWRHLAARFAAKEALLKALTTGLAGTMQWRDIEIVRDAAGAPRLHVTGGTGEMLSRTRVRTASVSLSHVRSVAVAVVILVPA